MPHGACKFKKSYEIFERSCEHQNTDRHSIVNKCLKDCHTEKNHYFGVWHIAKRNSG